MDVFAFDLRYLHYDHHKYNKEHTMSPFAGLAFHPLDGILQVFGRGIVRGGGDDMKYREMH